MKKALIVMLSLIALLTIPCNAKDIRVLPSDIRGAVIRPDGETPVKNMQVVIWDQSLEKAIFKTRTDKNGIFVVPKYDRGDYFVKVGNIFIDMGVFSPRVDVKPQQHGFVIVLPKRMPMTAPVIVTPFMALPKIMSP